MARVLVMDEDVMAQRSAVDALHGAGHQVQSVCCLGGDALRGVVGRLVRFDVLIADADLPEWSRVTDTGLDWRVLCPGRPTILLSKLCPVATDRFRDDQMFIQKPVGGADLIQQVRELTSRLPNLGA